MSNIEWTEKTWNPLAGCSMCSPGCAKCYAETMAKRLKAMAMKDVADEKDPGRKRYYLDVIGSNGKWNGHIALIPEALDEPLRRKKPTTWFVNSMSDLFHPDVPFDFVDRVFAVMALTPKHTYQILTKRPERMAEYLRDDGSRTLSIIDGMKPIVGKGAPFAGKGLTTHLGERERLLPLPNVWLGTSVEDQKRADERIPHLLRCPAAVRFLSCEPLLGPVVLNCLKCPYCDGPEADYHTACCDTIDWVIVGGESGHGARPCNVAWVRSIVEQCRDAGVAVFVKQLGARPLISGIVEVKLNDSKGGDPSEWTEDLRVREMPRLAEVTR